MVCSGLGLDEKLGGGNISRTGKTATYIPMQFTIGHNKMVPSLGTLTLSWAILRSDNMSMPITLLVDHVGVNVPLSVSRKALVATQAIADLGENQ